MKTDYKKLIVSKLKRSGKKPVRYKELLRDCKRKHFDIDKFYETHRGDNRDKIRL